jgi:hypothetical protein
MHCVLPAPCGCLRQTVEAATNRTTPSTSTSTEELDDALALLGDVQDDGPSLQVTPQASSGHLRDDLLSEWDKLAGKASGQTGTRRTPGQGRSKGGRNDDAEEEEDDEEETVAYSALLKDAARSA